MIFMQSYRWIDIVIYSTVSIISDYSFCVCQYKHVQSQSPLVLIFQKTFAFHLDLPHVSPHHAIKPTERSGGHILLLNSINQTECMGLPWNPSISSADSPATIQLIPKVWDWFCCCNRSWWKKSFGREGPEPLPGVSCTNKSKTGRKKPNWDDATS